MATPQDQMEPEPQQPAAPAPPAAPAAAPPGQDVTSQLAELAQLKAQGALTDEEFQAAKKKLLGT